MANGFNPYAYQDKFAGAGDAAAAAVAENEARRKAFLDEEDRELKRQMSQLQFGELKAKQAEALVVPGDTGFNNVDLAINNASRQLVDQAGALTAQLNKGEISVDDWASQTALIRSQVPGVKQWKETLNTNLGQYTQALANGQLSDAMDPSSMDLYGTLLKDDGRLNLAVNDQGQVVFEGTTEGGSPVSIPVNGSANMPKPVLKQPSPYEIMKEPLKEFNNQGWSEDVAEFSRQQLDSVLAKGGDQALLSMAVDHMGIPANEARELANMEADGYTSALEQQVEEKWVEDARAIHIYDQQKQQKALLEAKKLELQQQRLEATTATQNRQLDYTERNLDLQEDKWNEKLEQEALLKENRAITATHIKEIDPESSDFIAQMSAQGIVVAQDKKSGKYGVQEGKNWVPFNSAKEAKNYVLSKFGTPLKRKSPFKRLGDWINNMTK